MPRPATFRPSSRRLLVAIATLAVGACSGASSTPAATGQPSDTPAATAAGERFRVVDGPIAFALVGDEIWVTGHEADAIGIYDRASLTERRRIKLEAGSGPGSIAVTNDAVWVTNQNGLGVTRLRFDGTVDGIAAPEVEPCCGLALAAGSVWVADHDAGTVSRIDPATMAVTAIDAGTDADGLLVLRDRVWGYANDHVFSIDPETDKVTQTEIKGFPCAAAFDSLWVVTGSGPVSLERVDPDTGTVAATIPIGDRTNGCGSSDTAVFALVPVLLPDASTVIRIDPASNTAGAPVRIPGGEPSNLGVVDGRLLITEWGNNMIARIAAD